jgi:hypothetical protein
VHEAKRAVAETRAAGIEVIDVVHREIQYDRRQSNTGSSSASGTGTASELAVT